MPGLNVPFVDLRGQHEEVRRQIEVAIADIIDRSSFIGGSYVSTFEREFAEYLGVKEVVGLANGTDAMWLALLGAGVKAGDAVITVPNTFIATIEAITRLRAPWKRLHVVEPCRSSWIAPSIPLRCLCMP